METDRQQHAKSAVPDVCALSPRPHHQPKLSLHSQPRASLLLSVERKTLANAAIIQGLLIENGMLGIPVNGHKVVDECLKCGGLVEARLVFDEIPSSFEVGFL
ncbi:hypothetical protein MLD38_031349 [Melastoma candidum]|uniref:Uncharacterized protein n=1 Tax=Melastoma candidum TaxID=119954 RepID=A0ACB9MP14_9MYRT|nr:hypothetical protein MLD38_031349 [Melastoma candidum]